MASGTIPGTTGNQYIDSRIVWSSTTTTASNTSKVTATLQYKRNNSGFTTSGTGSFSITVNGSKTSASKTLTITENEWVTAVSTTVTVNHDDDGTKSINISASGSIPNTTLNSTSCSDTVDLDTIPRASTLSYVSNVTLGDICTLRWTPHSKGFYYKIKFKVGGWSITSAAIHPNITTLYTNASYGVSLDAAHQFTNSKDADMTVTLYTYSDKECTKQVGSETTENCKVYIPENENTIPAVAMSLSPVSVLSEGFNGLYLQNKTKVQANFTGTKAMYSASISSYSMDVGGKTYGSPYLSDLLSKSGRISVKGTVVDSRGLSASVTPKITVIPYLKPSLVPYTGESSIICKRCDDTGIFTPSGIRIRIKAGRQYSKVVSDGVQKNFCLMRFRYKVEGTTAWGSWRTILAKDNASDIVDITLTDINLSPSTTYLAQIEVVDDVGESINTLIAIPTADVTVHLRHGGKAVGIGKYAEKDNIVDIDDEWEVNARGDLRVGKTFYPDHIASIDSYGDKDFNELIYKTGYYSGTSAPSAVSAVNYPINETGMLEVISCMGQNAETLAWWGFAYQTYKTHTGNMYIRSYYSTTGWTNWKKVTLT